MENDPDDGMNMLPRIFGRTVDRGASRLSLQEWKARFWEGVFSRPEHGWIRADDGIARSFCVLVDGFTERARCLIEDREEILFHSSDGVLGSAFGGRDGLGVVIVYPDLRALLGSGAFMMGVAVLAHELGHIAFGHSERDVSVFVAQIEADYFAFLLGFGQETRALLLERTDSPNVRERIRHLDGLLV